MNEVILIRSARKTVSLRVLPEGRLEVRAPYGLSEAELERILREKAEWIRRARKRLTERAAAQAEEAVQAFSPEELARLKAEAVPDLTARAARFAPLVGVTPRRVSVRAQRTRWGSCSAKGNLSFNCLLMLVPEEVRDSVVVHELCHLKVMNHSPRFYREVKRVFPAYEECSKWLKKNGGALIRRLPRKG